MPPTYLQTSRFHTAVTCTLTTSLVRKFFSSSMRLGETASLLQCAIDTAPEPAASGAASEFEWDNLAAVSIAAVSRHCDTMMKACVALPWEAKLDVPYWLKELENLKASQGLNRCLGENSHLWYAIRYSLLQYTASYPQQLEQGWRTSKREAV